MTDITRRDQQAGRLRQARKMRGFDGPKAAADFFGFNYNTYAQHENGRAGITHAAKKYARAYKVREAWLLTGDGEPDDVDGSDELRDVFSRVATAPAEVQTAVLSYARFVLDNFEKSRETATTPAA